MAWAGVDVARLVYDNLSGETEEVIVDSENPVVVIGRSSECTIRSNRKSVSRQHAEVRYLGKDGYEVVDLNSSNGVYLIINGERQRVYECEYLSNGDEIWCGDYIIRFYDEAEDDDLIASPFAATSAFPYTDETPLNTSLPSNVPTSVGLDDAPNDYQAVLAQKEELELALHRQSDENVSLKAEVQRLKAQLKGLSHDFVRDSLAEYDGPNTQDISSLREELVILKNENASLKEERFRSSRLGSQLGNQDVDARIDELERELKSNQIRESVLNEELNLVKRENIKLRKLANERGDEAPDAYRDSQEGNDPRNHVHLSALRERLEGLEAEKARLYKMLLEEREGVAKWMNEAQLRESEIQQILDEKIAMAAELSRFNGRISQLVEEKNVLQKENEQLSNELEEARKSLDAKKKPVIPGLKSLMPVVKSNDLSDINPRSTHLGEDPFKEERLRYEQEIASLRQELDREIKRFTDVLKEKDRVLSKDRLEKDQLKEQLDALKEQQEEELLKIERQTKDLEIALQRAKSDNPLHYLDDDAVRRGTAAVEALKLVVDAIARTDLQPLSMIDRVRLQGALQDLKADASIEFLLHFMQELKPH